eukprot:m.67129 g.67129  ORF g.67129 m.67129 type:complete len:509 (-) comp12157_c2_seq3:861-2387(-)
MADDDRYFEHELGLHPFTQPTSLWKRPSAGNTQGTKSSDALFKTSSPSATPPAAMYRTYLTEAAPPTIEHQQYTDTPSRANPTYTTPEADRYFSSESFTDSLLYGPNPQSGDSGIEEQLRIYKRRDGIIQEELQATQRDNDRLARLVNELNSKVVALELENREASQTKQRLRSLELYLQTLPTPTEHEQMKADLHDRGSVVEGLKDELHDTQVHLSQTKRALHEQQDLVQELETEISHMKKELVDTRETKLDVLGEIRAANRQLMLERDQARTLYDQVSTELSSRIAEHHTLIQRLEAQQDAQREHMAAAEEREKVVSELQHRQLDFVTHERELRTMVEDLESVRSDLVKKISAQASTIRDLRESISALSAQNQQLLSANQRWRLNASSLDESASAPTRHLSSIAETKASGTYTATEVDALQDMLGDTLEQFGAVFDLALSRLNREDVQLRRLLGLSASRDAPLFVRTTDMESRMQSVREMQEYIAHLRDCISDAYAHEMAGDACNVQ